MKAVFHLSDRDPAQWSRGLGNISNLLEDETVDCEDVVLVVNSDAVHLLRRGSGYAEEIVALADRGVTIAACRNTLERSSLGTADLIPAVKTVTTAMGAIARLQTDGYAYIKP